MSSRGKVTSYAQPARVDQAWSEWRIRSASALHDPQPLAEPGERPEQAIERAVRDELIAPAQRDDHVLADAAALAAGFDDLKILARVRPGATTLHAHEHAVIIDGACSSRKKEVGLRPRRVALHFRTEIRFAPWRCSLLLRNVEIQTAE